MPPVVLMMTDGMRPDALQQVNAPHIQGVLAEGAYTLTAQSVMPSITLPCHTSIFHSVPPSRHGITSNDWHPMARPVLGLVDMAALQGKRCAFFYNWEQLRDLNRPGTLYYSHCIATAEYVEDGKAEGDRYIAEFASGKITEHNIDFAFVYFGTIDMIGHVYGWMSDEYLRQIEQVDAFIGQVLSTLPEDTTVLIQSDHGGHDRSHGTDMVEDMTIPWMIRGPGIKRNHAIQAPVSLLDTAPTLAHILGINPAPEWEGRCISEIFA
jgi:predicted AlkP superfamily pyrophosphatase or phosphodiesterase